MTVTWTNITVRLGDLIPWSRNPKTISKTSATRLLALWEKLGQFQTIAIGPNCEVYDGHQRLSVLMSAHGRDFEVDARQSSRELTEKEREELVVAAHVGTVGQFDWEQLSGWDAPELIAWGMDDTALKDWKQDVNALSALLESEKQEVDAEPQIDRAAELNEKWRVKTGDLWKIGEHRLLCGDSTIKADVDRVMGGEKAAISFTSPPYNVGKTPNGNEQKYQDDSDNKTSGEYLDLLSNFTTLALSVSDYVFVNVQSVSGNKCTLVDYLFCLKDKYADVIIWDKTTAEPAMAKNVLNSRFEFVYVFSDKATRTIGTKEFRGTIDNVLFINSRQEKEQSDIHKATFPTEFASFFIDNFSNEHESVYEPFCGSGTTMVACENLRRKCRAIEISPNYCAVILERMATAFPELEIVRLTE